MTHTYIINEENIIVFSNDGEEVGKSGPWETSEEADAYAQSMLEGYNSSVTNPDNKSFPSKLA